MLGVWLLSSCTLYHKVVHPYRLPTPKPSPEYKAQLEAKKKKEKALLSFQHDADKKAKANGDDTEEAATDVSTPSGGTMGTPVATTTEPRTLPERSTVRYDKKGLMKKPKLKRRKVNKQHKPFRPLQSIKDFFKYGLHKKPNYDIDHKVAPKAPQDEPAPNPAPDDAGSKP
ncbi:hypothetical protein MUN81_03050 [Hymenobacter sp. 5317J-9]|uniref:hypothetical protein n=1 Tax=Hymenobacter sp. 5317J-9 TaxID=2932250 RepID=UPI001FD6FF01|nr:hypothetical protein [Hymenobacter sp. 5317J-9]UOQ98472.1 hypothetical protein MUN81_03050 [Hymenobacter sp. 5317J-9]